MRIYQDLRLRSAYGTFPYCATPKGLANTVGLCPTPHVRHVAGVQATPTANTCTPTTDRWVASDQSRPQPLRGCFASLDSSPAPRCWTGFLDSPKHRPKILRISVLSFWVSEFLSYLTGFGHGSRAAQPCISPLTHERCPTHAQSRGADGCSICTPATWRTWGVGQSPTVLTSPLGGALVGDIVCRRHSFCWVFCALVYTQIDAPF